MSITIQGTTGGAYWTLLDSKDNLLRPFMVNDYDFIPDIDGISFTMEARCSKSADRFRPVDKVPYTDVVNGDTAEVFADFASLQDYILSNFFRNAGISPGSVEWGGITGDISAQSDLQAELNTIPEIPSQTNKADYVLSTTGTSMRWHDSGNVFLDNINYFNQVSSQNLPYGLSGNDEILRFDAWYVINSNSGDPGSKNQIQISYTDFNGIEQLLTVAEAGVVGAVLVPSVCIYAKADTTVSYNFNEINADINFSGGVNIYRLKSISPP